MDADIIDSSFKKISENEAMELKTHFVYGGNYYDGNYHDDHMLPLFILKGMQKYKIRSVMLTIFSMVRSNLITKEKMEEFCKSWSNSNDDLDSFFEDLRLGKELDQGVMPYFLPKLTK